MAQERSLMWSPGMLAVSSCSPYSETRGENVQNVGPHFGRTRLALALSLVSPRPVGVC